MDAGDRMPPPTRNPRLSLDHAGICESHNGCCRATAFSMCSASGMPRQRGENGIGAQTVACDS